MSVVLAQVEHGVGLITLNRPEARNAIDRATLDALHAVLAQWRERQDIDVIVFSGAGGKAFAGGADIVELKTRGQAQAFLGLNQVLFQAVEALPQTTIAAIDGYALGGGLELALACDLRVASRSARMGLPETSLGIFPGAGGTWRLPRLVGLGRAKALIFTGKTVDADEALAMGLVEFVCEGAALERARQVAADVQKTDFLARRVAKLALNEWARKAELETLERLGQALLFDSPEKHRRMQAFLDKKKPT